MLCNWSTTASNFLRARAVRASHICCEHAARTPWTRQFASSQSNIQNDFTSSTPTSLLFPPPAHLSRQPPPMAWNRPNLTAAQISLASSQAVRLSIANKKLADAYQIVNFLRYTSLRDNSAAKRKLQSTREDVVQYELSAKHLGCEVSPRLSSHALLHGLLRIGLTKKAYELSRLMMDTGIRLRSATLEAVIRGLVPDPSDSPPRRAQLSPANFAGLKHPNVLTLTTPKVEHPGTRFALQLLFLAGKSNQHRTSGMFKLLIYACIINGEIIAASLLFGLLVKECQLRTTISNHLEQHSSPGPNLVTAENVHKSKALGVYAQPLGAKMASPRMGSMLRILDEVDNSLSRGVAASDVAFYSRQAALQALTNMVVLLDQKLISPGRVPRLIASICRCPDIDNLVWIRDENGKPIHVPAYTYIHGVLERLIDSLSSHSPTIPHTNISHPIHHHLPTLNGLLHYAFRHRFSPAMAGKIISHMNAIDLTPDTVTYNIILRTGSLSHSPKLAETALKGLRSIGASLEVATAPRSPTSPTSPSHPSPELDLDPHSLSSYFAHLISTEQLPLVIHFAKKIVHLSHKRRTKRLRKDHQLFLQRLQSLGPYLFTTLLNALCKAGQIELAKRVWILARRAERTSWVRQQQPDGGGGGGEGRAQRYKPWCLPIHAYTIMMRCYRIGVKHEIHASARRRNQPLPIRAGKRKAKTEQAVLEHLAVGLYCRLFSIHKPFSRAIVAAGVSEKWVGAGMLKRGPIADDIFFNEAIRLFAPARRKGQPKESGMYHGVPVQRWRYEMMRRLCSDMGEAGYEVPRGWDKVFRSSRLQRDEEDPRSAVLTVSTPRLGQLCLPIRRKRGLGWQGKRTSYRRRRRRAAGAYGRDS